MGSDQQEDRIRGRKFRWIWTDGPVEGTTIEHTFFEDGTVEWRVADGPQKGHSAREKEYAAVRLADDLYLVSYLGASGYTLTVVMNFEDDTMTGFASGAKEWYRCSGRFELIE